jgi:hypothetical protein
LRSGDGATADVIPAVIARRDRPVAASGMVGRAGLEAAIFDARACPDWGSMSSGGITMLCALGSGLTNIFCWWTVWGSALGRGRGRARRLSSAGKDFDGA